MSVDVLNAEEFQNKILNRYRLWKRGLFSYLVTEKQMDLIYFHVTKLFILTIPAMANILDSGKGFDIVIRNIARDEEATYDYRSFPRDSD